MDGEPARELGVLLHTLEIAELQLGVARTSYAADDDRIARAEVVAIRLGQCRHRRRHGSRDGAVGGGRAGGAAGREAGGEGHY